MRSSIRNFDEKQWETAQGPYQKEAIRRCFWRSCLNCDYWEDGKAVAGKTAGQPAGCRKAGGNMPPAEVIVHGCDGYEMLIPF